ncbi:hypothetical protein NIES2119_05900 [[Phormidium ambiguum] IAM M-71]|uniref:DUF1818 domain-containing protein n=1 Tax=[Phormidium ambiguum] IAM M-71 TaxID=454136 RepID=A0A1U7IQY7_9CYAN|nr:DUF1818 family protein [Phormidium ambiguum]OKH39776.1 hypothetical protein NIES2119_05900 [Phormidium ambiguum IAM M-71]
MTNDKLMKSGEGWRLGWNPNAEEFQGLLGGDDWAIELTEAELNDFCRLFAQLAATMKQIASELMDEERIATEAETDLIWLEVEGYPHSYSLHLMLNSGRRCEGSWSAEAVPHLLQAIQTFQVF